MQLLFQIGYTLLSFPLDKTLNGDAITWNAKGVVMQADFIIRHRRIAASLAFVLNF